MSSMVHMRCRRAIAVQALCGSLALLACGGSSDRPMPDGPVAPSPDAAADGAVDAPAPDPVAVLVAKDGNDTHDGIHMPVETLKRALAIAAADPRVTEIVMGTGSYTTRDGETFPYTVPRGLGIAGAAGGAGPPGRGRRGGRPGFWGGAGAGGTRT